MKAVLAVLALAALTGCSTYPINLPQMQVRTNIPYHSTTVTVVNNTGFELNVIHDGRLVREKLQPGQYFTAELYNFSGYGTQSSLVTTAYSPDGKFVGTSDKCRIYVDGYARRSEPCIINRWDIRN